MATKRASYGLVGTFDVDSFDVQVAWQVTSAELSRRRPDLTLRAFAPFGSTRPVAVAAGATVEPLLPASAARTSQLATELGGLVVVDPPFPLGDLVRVYRGDPEPDTRDVARAAAWLDTPDVGLPVARVPRAPHPGLLARRHWPHAMCEDRRAFLRALQWWPQHGAAAVVQGGAPDVGLVDLLAAALPGGDVVALETEPGDEVFAEALVTRLGPRAAHVPANRSSVEDRIAALAGASLVVWSSLAVAAVADSFGRPNQDLAARLAHAEPSDPPYTLSGEAVLDAAYDDLACLDGGRPRPVTVDGEVAALRAALAAQREQMAHERIVLADYVRAVRTITTEQLRDLERALATRLTSRVVRSVRQRLGRGA